MKALLLILALFSANTLASDIVSYHVTVTDSTGQIVADKTVNKVGDITVVPTILAAGKYMVCV